MKRKLRPADCTDMFTAKKLEEQGIKFNDTSLTIHPVYVEITHRDTTLRMSMALFTRLAEWYLTPQEIED